MFHNCFGRKPVINGALVSRQVSAMADDGSEEIMFICEWPGLSSGGAGVARAVRAKPRPHFVFLMQTSVSFPAEMVLLALRPMIHYMRNVLWGVVLTGSSSSNSCRGGRQLISQSDPRVWKVIYDALDLW